MNDLADAEFLKQALKRCRAIEDEIFNDAPKEISSASQTFLVANLFQILIQHHRAIRMLIEEGSLDASATALLRPFLEAGYKILSLKYLAAPERIRQIDLGQADFPKLTKVLADRIAKASGRDSYRRQSADLDILHDLTHGGVEQQLRQYDPGSGIVGVRDLREIANLAGRTATFSAMVFLEINQILAN